MAKSMELCVPCAEKMKEVYDIKKEKRGVNMKVFCICCQKMRYGSVYQVVVKK